MVCGRGGGGLDWFRILLYWRWLLLPPGAADFLYLDEFLFRLLRGLHALARILPARSGYWATRSDGILITAANPTPRALSVGLHTQAARSEKRVFGSAKYRRRYPAIYL